MNRVPHFVIMGVFENDSLFAGGSDFFCGVANEEYVQADAWTNDRRLARKYVTHAGARLAAELLTRETDMVFAVLEVRP